MLRTASSLPLAGLLTLGSGPARFPAEPPACYRASWQLPGPDFHRQATTSLRTRGSAAQYTASPPALLGARNIEASLIHSRTSASTRVHRKPLSRQADLHDQFCMVAPNPEKRKARAEFCQPNSRRCQK
jgi:hypothetical protein